MTYVMPMETCVKCGTTDEPIITYVEDPRLVGTDQDYLRIVCNVCGYTHNEDCKDSKNKDN